MTPRIPARVRVGVVIANTLGVAGQVALQLIDCTEHTIIRLFPSRPGPRA